jgi:hypothetical protein
MVGKTGYKYKTAGSRNSELAKIYQILNEICEQTVHAVHTEFIKTL